MGAPYRDCNTTAQEGFPNLSEAAVIDTCKSSESFKKSFLLCDQVRQGIVPGSFKKQRVTSSKSCGYTMSKTYMALTLHEFAERFKT